MENAGPHPNQRSHKHGDPQNLKPQKNSLDQAEPIDRTPGERNRHDPCDHAEQRDDREWEPIAAKTSNAAQRSGKHTGAESHACECNTGQNQVDLSCRDRLIREERQAADAIAHIGESLRLKNRLAESADSVS
jgi:hypothetical protein